MVLKYFIDRLNAILSRSHKEKRNESEGSEGKKVRFSDRSGGIYYGNVIFDFFGDNKMFTQTTLPEKNHFVTLK